MALSAMKYLLNIMKWQGQMEFFIKFQTIPVSSSNLCLKMVNLYKVWREFDGNLTV
jgi:hypothetical protein